MLELTHNEMILLPKGYLSWSQMQVWKTNPERYKREYFLGRNKLDTKYLQFGKGIARMIQLGLHKELLPDLIVFDLTEYEIRTAINGVPVLSFIDDYDPKEHIFGEKKTGKIPWTQAKVQKHDQLTFYASGLRAKQGEMPDHCILSWIETTESHDENDTDFFAEFDKKVNCTGKVKTFTRYFDERELDRMDEDILKTATEISDAYKAFMAEL